MLIDSSTTEWDAAVVQKDLSACKFTDQCVWTVYSGLNDYAIHPSEVGKWVVIHVIRYMDYGVKA